MATTPTLPPSTDWAGAREAGSRVSNEDFFTFTNPRDPVLSTHGVLILVCDGVGGERGGGVAAETAVSIFEREFHASDPGISLEVRLRQCSAAADQQIKRHAVENVTHSRMATTVVAAVVLNNEVHVVNAGDSRAYIVRANGAVLEQVSADHSWLQVQRDLGVKISEARARTHEKRSTITRSLGGAPNSEVDYRSAILLQGDRVLLCSDGISGVLSAESILNILRDHSDPSQAVQALFDGAGRSRAPDNMSAVILNYGAPQSVTALTAQQTGRAKALARWTVGGFLGAGALIGTLAFVNGQSTGDRTGPPVNAGTSVPARSGQELPGTPPLDRRTRTVDVSASGTLTTSVIAATPTVAPTLTLPPPTSTSTPIPTSSATATPRPPTPVPSTTTAVPPSSTPIPPTPPPPTATLLPSPTSAPTQAPPSPPTVNQPSSPTPNTRR